jgi:hypothetical protein
MLTFLPTSHRTARVVGRSLPWLGHCWPASLRAPASRVSPPRVVGIERRLVTVASVKNGADLVNIRIGGKQNLTVRSGSDGGLLILGFIKSWTSNLDPRDDVAYRFAQFMN